MTDDPGISYSVPAQAVRGLQERLDAATARADAAERDTARLDWLEANRKPLIPCWGLRPPMGSDLPSPFEGYVLASQDEPILPLRAAIDAARQSP